jgi:hypothetical protein
VISLALAVGFAVAAYIALSGMRKYEVAAEVDLPYSPRDSWKIERWPLAVGERSLLFFSAKVEDVDGAIGAVTFDVAAPDHEPKDGARVRVDTWQVGHRISGWIWTTPRPHGDEGVLFRAWYFAALGLRLSSIQVRELDAWAVKAAALLGTLLALALFPFLPLRSIVERLRAAGTGWLAYARSQELGVPLAIALVA